jgi:hypothetical protein
MERLSRCFLAGSVAYAPSYSVTEKSDLDLIIIHDNVRQLTDRLQLDSDDKVALRNRHFEGYCLKTRINDIDVSYHILDTDTFNTISTCYVADIRVYRSHAKNQTYDLLDFQGKDINIVLKTLNYLTFKASVLLCLYILYIMIGIFLEFIGINF